MTNKSQSEAKRNKNDEFYTQLSDIEEELRHYNKHFKGKTVYCNCDDPSMSAFFCYFSTQFRFLELKRLITTCYKNDSRDLFSHNNKSHSIMLDYTRPPNDKGGMPKLKDIKKRKLKGDGDFRSDECIEILQEADIVVTNPPFSKFRDYLPQLIDHKKQFLIIGNKSAITYKEIFPLFKDNQMWLGCSPMGRDMLFDVPDEYAKELVDDETKKERGAYKIVDGVVKGRAPTVWFTNLTHKKRNEELILTARYDPKKYPKYDNYNAIEVGKVAKLPRDYAGAMGVPISFMDKFNPKQFEILGATQRECHDEVPDTKKYDDYWEVRQNGEKTGSSGGKTNENGNLLRNDGKNNYFINKKGRVIQSAYQRIFIKNKHPERKR